VMDQMLEAKRRRGPAYRDRLREQALYVDLGDDGETWFSCSVAMKMTGHKTESVYRRYTIVSDGDLRDAAVKLAAVRATNGDSSARLR